VDRPSLGVLVDRELEMLVYANNRSLVDVLAHTADGDSPIGFGTRVVPYATEPVFHNASEMAQASQA
jgi:hypothetical protein